MKKTILIVSLVMVIFIAFNENVISWVKSNFASSQTPYYQQRLEFFEKLSKEYYGVSDYGKELEVINRPFEITELSTDRNELIIPSLDAIIRLKQRQTIASLEPNPDARMITMDSRLSKYSSEGKTITGRGDYLKSSTFIVLGSIAFVSAIVSLLSYFKFCRKKRHPALFNFPDEDPKITDDRILLGFDLSSYEEKIGNSSRTYFEKAVV